MKPTELVRLPDTLKLTIFREIACEEGSRPQFGLNSLENQHFPNAWTGGKWVEVELVSDDQNCHVEDETMVVNQTWIIIFNISRATWNTKFDYRMEYGVEVEYIEIEI